MFDPDRIYVIDPYHLSVMSVCGYCVEDTVNLMHCSKP